jgi:hypothetical protein
MKKYAPHLLRVLSFTGIFLLAFQGEEAPLIDYIVMIALVLNLKTADMMEDE